MRRAMLTVGLIAGCTPAPTQAPAGVDAADGVAAADAPAAVVEVSGAGAAAPACADAGCWARLADEAAARGATDVAASHRGQAFRGEPSVTRLTSWVDALVAGGELRRAREGLAEARALAERRGDRALVAEVARRLAGLPASAGGSIDAPPLSEAQRAAYMAAAAGRVDEAATSLAAAHAGEPLHLAHAGDLTAGRDPVAARRLWSAARAGFHERGAEVRVDPVETWYTGALAWRGDEPARLRRWTLIEDSQDGAGVVELQAASAGAGLRRLLFARPANVLAFTADGQGLLRDAGGEIVLQDLLTGSSVRTVAKPGGRVGQLETAGVGDDLLVLASGEEGAALWDARGELVERFPLKGTTPTIIRAYTGEGTYHHNILRDSPTWPAALAMTEKATLVAVGGSDSKVRVFDRTRKTMKLLEYTWTYVEHRHMGGNPDLNPPLALRFDASERLIGLFGRGDIFVWDPRTGKTLQHHPGRCSSEEATDDVNRYAEPGTPRRAPTAEETENCGRAVVGDISPDGTTVVTGGGLSGFRVRSVATGKSVKYVASNALPDMYLAMSGGGAVGMANLYGAMSVWRPGAADVEALRPPEPSSPLTPALASDGRVLHFEVEQREQFWDLQERRALVVVKGKERVLAVGPDIRHAAVRTPGGIELREVLTGKVVFTQAVEARLSSNARVARGGRAVFWLSDGTASLQVVLVTPDGKSTTQVTDEVPVLQSDDGRWLVTTKTYMEMIVRDARGAGRIVHTLGGVKQLAISRDGKRMAWLAQEDRERPVVALRERSIEGKDDQKELTLLGWPESVGYAPDGEVLALLESGRMTRWRPATGERFEAEQVAMIMPNAVMIADDGKTLWLPGYRAVQIRSNDRALRPIANLYPLLSGGWMVVSAAGAVDGSDDAVGSLMTRVQAGGATQVYDGRLGWDGAFVAGTAVRALAGEDVRPPVLVRAPPPEKPPVTGP